MVPSTRDVAQLHVEALKKCRDFTVEFTALVDLLIHNSRVILLGVEGMEDEHKQLLEENQCKTS